MKRNPTSKQKTARKLKATVRLGVKVRRPHDYSLSVHLSEANIVIKGERLDRRKAQREIVKDIGYRTEKSVIKKHGTKSNQIELSLSARDATR